MGKKIGRLMIAACIALVLLAAGTALAEDPATPTDIDKPTDPPAWEIQDDVLVACRVTDENITVPDGIRVIGPNAFKGLKTMKSVTLPDSVTAPLRNAQSWRRFAWAARPACRRSGIMLS